MTDDATLLRRYAEERSEDAFTELARRHVDFVFSVAMREVRGDFARAQDITQEVFTALARKASVLHQRTTLVGWLHISVHHAAANLMRSEQRRERREQEALAMHEQSQSPTPPDEWERVKPVLNEVVQELGTADRDALLLRFYEQRPFREIGETLRVSEDAVQKRVERALEKMRAGLVKRGITSTSVALTLMLQNNAVVAAPAGLAGTVTQGALTAASGGGGTAIFHLMSIGKIQFTIAAALVVAGVTTITLQHRDSLRLGEEISGLQRENRQLALLRVENNTAQAELESLRAEHAEAVRLRGDVEALRAKQAAPAATSAPVSPPAPEAMRPLEALHNIGNATPASALESLIWAKESLDVATLSKLFTLTPDVRKKLDAIFADFPETERAKHGISTPEEMLAFFFAGLAKPFSGLQITEQHEIDSDNMAFRVVLQLRGGGTNKSDFIFRRSVDGGWQWVMPGGLVDELPNELKKLDAAKPDSK